MCHFEDPSTESPGRRTHELELTIDDGFPWDVAAVSVRPFNAFEQPGANDHTLSLPPPVPLPKRAYKHPRSMHSVIRFAKLFSHSGHARAS